MPTHPQVAAANPADSAAACQSVAAVNIPRRIASFPDLSLREYVKGHPPTAPRAASRF